MAKQAVKKVNRKAPKKVTKKKENPYIKRFFIGLVLVFSSILGMFNFGILGNWLTYGFEYLFGIYYLIVFISVFVMGFFLIIKKPLFKLRDTKTIGGLLIFVSLTTWSTMAKLVEIKGLDVINRFIESMKLAVKPFGGGLVGALFYAPMSSLFGSQGTLIALVIMIIIGATLIIGTAYLTFVKDRYKHYRENQKAQKEGRKQSQGIKDEEDLIENQPKLKIFNDQDFEQVDAITNLEIFENEEGEAIVETIDEVMVKETSTEPVIHSSMPLEIKDDEIVKEPKSTKAYRLPPLYLLKSNSVKANVRGNLAKAKENAQLLVQVMKQFGINVEITDIHIGPSVTKYEVKPEVGVRVNKIASLQDDIKMALSAKDIRIEAPIPGKPAVGIEIPNLESTMVTLKEVLQEAPKPEESNRLLVGLGRDIAGRPVNTHLDRTPHLLVAGATGSGKSVCINSIIVSLLMRTKPDEVKLLLVDPKKVELNVYNGVPHLLAPVVTDPKKAAVALRKIVIEMEARYELFSSAGVRNIKGYNAYLETKNQGVTEAEKIAPLPYIVAIVDELADLMMVASKDVEDAIMRITQMARAAGIHLIVATQRPSTDVITGIIKANIPSRIAFAVSSSIDSRTILDSSGAERLLGKGDMLFAPMGENHAVRIQGSFVSDEEVNTVVEYVAKQQPADFDDQFVKLEATEASGGMI